MSITGHCVRYSGWRRSSPITYDLGIYRQSTVRAVSTIRPCERSESRLKYLDDTRYAGVNLCLLSDSENDGASEWDVPTIGIHVAGAIDRLIAQFEIGRFKVKRFVRSAADEVITAALCLSRSSELPKVQRGYMVD